MEIHIGKIILYEHIDSAKLQALQSAGHVLLLDIERRYALPGVPENVSVSLPVGFGDDETYMPALAKVINAAGFAHENGALVYNIQYNAGTKTFDFSGSYERITVNGTQKAIAAGQELIAVFTTPGLPNSTATVITLKYGQGITQTDINSLAAVGLQAAKNSTGTLLSFELQKTPYTVEFYRSEAATVPYVIDFDMNAQIINV